MLNLLEFPTQPNWSSILPITISKARPFPVKTPQPHSSFPSHRVTRFYFCYVQRNPRTGFCSYASKSEGEGGNHLLEREHFDGADAFEEYEDEDDEDDDEDEVFVSLRDMKEWIKNRPRGFGEGKVYDTSIEDKLMEEIEQSRTAQLANINKLKNNPVNPSSMKKQVPREEASKDIHDVFRVRLFNLPKKKNIHRDLQLAFKGFHGIINITPVVSGNKKTRDPICKGIAFVDFRSKDGAQRFVQTFSGQSIYFGKVQKYIKCEMMYSSSTKPKNERPVDETSYDPELSDGESEADFEINAHTEDLWEENDYRDYDTSIEHISAQSDENVETYLVAESGDEQDDVIEVSATDVSFSTIQKEIEVNEQKKKAKRKKQKTSKLNILGSAQRLKIREKAVLTGVLSKYGLNNAEGKKEQS